MANPESVVSNPGFIRSFTRSQVASVVATAVDFGIIFSFTELLRVWYVASVAIGAFAGAVTNFLMNRHWSFAAGHKSWRGQALRYSLVSTASLLLNTGGVWLVTEKLRIHYAVSVVTVSVGVGVFFNFPLQRSFVFRR